MFQHIAWSINGLLTEIHFDGTNLMQQLLESEALLFVDNQIVDFDSVFGLKPNGVVSLSLIIQVFLLVDK
jgi:hypothetical protein